MAFLIHSWAKALADFLLILPLKLGAIRIFLRILKIRSFQIQPKPPLPVKWDLAQALLHKKSGKSAAFSNDFLKELTALPTP